MVIIKRFSAFVLCGVLSLVAFPFDSVQAQRARPAGASDVVVVLPFENSSTASEYNWIGASFADGLADLLNVPGIVVVSNDERELAYARLRLPLTTLPSRATAVKIARELNATMLVLGTYNIAVPPKGDPIGASLSGTARVIRVDEGRLTGEVIDGAWAARQYDFGGPVPTLQTMQGRLAYQVLYQRDQALTSSLNQFIDRATKVPPRAFESYVKGVMTDNPETRSAYFQNALLEYARANAGATYAQAAFELGQLYFRQGDYQRAAENYAKLQKTDQNYAEAAFYSALAYWRMKDLQRALGALMPMASDTPLTNIYNNAGALSVQAAREQKSDATTERNRLITQAISFLSRAADSSPHDPLVHFNYANALFMSGKYAEAAEQLRPVITANPQDGEALFFFAKALERSNQAEAATAADNEARKHLQQQYAKLQTEWQKSQMVTGIPVRLYVEFDRYSYIAATRPLTTNTSADQDSQNLLAKALSFYDGGRDEEALPELRRVLMVEPTNAEAYLLIGRINTRRGELDPAVSALKTAIFWEPKMIDAHILLGRIFLERKDRAQALGYAKTAVGLDPNNQEALGLMRQVETGAK
ncbi:MAG: tetratricopeptide repeat protein [Pyrinomonadaceae bacterium MAG19_C2-C3]|nr:tetratricopeptide repeat protein [Pyrinomonadaceae bacterium MAG19_C2-C3]